MKKLLIIGPIYKEIITKVNALPKGNEEYQVLGTEERIAGAGCELVSILKLFDFPYEFIAPVGTGYYGEEVQAYCEENNIPFIPVEEMSGSVLKMVDPEGHSALFCNQGCEYDFSLDYVQDLDLDEIGMIVVFGEMFTGKNPEDLIQAIDEMNKPTLFVPNDCSEVIDEVILNQIFHMSELFVNSSEASSISGLKEERLEKVAEVLQSETLNACMILEQKEGTYYCHEDEKYYLPSPLVTNPIHEIGGYMIARMAGVTAKQAIAFGNEFAIDCRNEMPDENVMDYEKRKLVDLIMGKK